MKDNYKCIIRQKTYWSFSMSILEVMNFITDNMLIFTLFRNEMLLISDLLFHYCVGDVKFQNYGDLNFYQIKTCIHWNELFGNLKDAA